MRFTASGSPVASFSIATTEKFTSREGEAKENTQWHNIVLWGKTAEAIHSYLTKGKQVYVEGRIETRKWQDKEGKDRWTTEIKADKIVLLGGGGAEGRPRQARPASSGAMDSHEVSGPDISIDAPNDDDIPF
jgi:single-strand DNA-binding protein